MTGALRYYRLVTRATTARGVDNVVGYGPTVEDARLDYEKRMEEINLASEALLLTVARMFEAGGPTDENERILRCARDLENLVSKYSRRGG